MLRLALGTFTTLLGLAAGAAAAPGQPGTNSLTNRHWFEVRTANFHIYSCGHTEAVARVAMRLEQFREAYALLAGTQAVASPPIVVMAFPDQATMQPFLPLYQGKPASLAALFRRGSDQNLIVFALSGTDIEPLKVIFHEYTHLLLGHNEPYWPLWLAEGMAEIYASFEVSGGYHARIGNPSAYHLRLLAKTPLLPLTELFAVTPRSPEYNERQLQGIFYSESWLLTHYLMLGGNPAHKADFRQLTPLRRQGEPPEQAFTDALHTTVPAMEAELRHYLAHGKLEPLELTLRASLATPSSFMPRSLTPMEVRYRLGDELLHIGRLDAAQSYFMEAEKLVSGSPLPYEGLGLLAARRGRHSDAVRYLHRAMQLGPLNFLAHYTYAREKFRIAASGTHMQPLEEEPAAEISAELQKSLALMPDFGSAQHLLGSLELTQGQDLSAAQKHIERAIELEPENLSYVLSLTQVQLAKWDPAAAGRTLEPLRLPYVEPRVRAHAEDMIKSLGQ